MALSVYNMGGTGSSIPDGIHNITLSANPTDGGTVSGGGMASDGMTVSVSADKNDGFKFSGWKEGETVVSTEALYTFLVSSDCSLTANFSEAERIIEILEANFPFDCLYLTHLNGTFIAFNNGLTKIAYSYDAVSWTSQNLPENEGGTFVEIIYVADKYILNLQDNALFYSEDLITWERKDNPISATIGINNIVVGNGKIIGYSGNNGHIYCSDDTITWSDVKSIGFNLQKIVYYNGKFISFYSNKVLYSNDGVSWISSVIPVTGKWTACTYSNEKIIAIDFNKGINAIYSDDGVIWHTSTIPGDVKYCRNVAYGNGKFIAIGNNNVVYSEDGITWKTVTINFSKKYFNLVAYGHNKFVFTNTMYEKIAYSSGEISTV